MTKVIHCKKEPFDVLIDRTTKWGNPFKIGPKCTRKQSLAQFRVWFPKQKHLMECLHEVKDKTLGCWCKPLDCHGDIIAEFCDGKERIMF